MAQVRFRTCGHEWVKLVVGSLLCSERFFSGFSGFPLSSKINISKFQFDRMQDLPENHFWVSGASWVNINNNYNISFIDDIILPQLSSLTVIFHSHQTSRASMMLNKLPEWFLDPAKRKCLHGFQQSMSERQFSDSK